METKTLDEIVDELHISKNKIKYIIEKMGITHISKGRNNHYTLEQIELIKENNVFNYDCSFRVYKSPIENPTISFEEIDNNILL